MHFCGYGTTAGGGNGNAAPHTEIQTNWATCCCTVLSIKHSLCIHQREKGCASATSECIFTVETEFLRIHTNWERNVLTVASHGYIHASVWSKACYKQRFYGRVCNVYLRDLMIDSLAHSEATWELATSVAWGWFCRLLWVPESFSAINWGEVSTSPIRAWRTLLMDAPSCRQRSLKYTSCFPCPIFP